MRKIKAGIIGTGFISEAHIEAVRRIGFADICAVAGSSLEKAKKMAEKHCIPKFYGDYTELLNDPDIEVVHNCTPNHIHFEVSKAIILSGKHILSEKPLTLNAEESEKLLHLVHGKNLIHGVNFNYRHYPMVQQIKALVESGELGDLHFAHGSYLQDWLLYENDYNWRMEPHIGGELRAIGDIGSHWIDLIQYISSQKVIEVFADSTIVHPVRKKPTEAKETFESSNSRDYEQKEVTTEDFATVLLRFSDGMKATLNVSQVSAGKKNELSFEVNGRKSSASWNQEEAHKIWRGYRDKANEVMLADPSLLTGKAREYIHYPGGHNEAWPDGMKNMMIQFYHAVRNETDLEKEPVSFSTFYEAHQMMQVLDAVNKSIKRQSWVTVEGGR